MSDFLGSLAARALGKVNVVQPRLTPMFAEPVRSMPDALGDPRVEEFTERQPPSRLRADANDHGFDSPDAHLLAGAPSPEPAPAPATKFSVPPGDDTVVPSRRATQPVPLSEQARTEQLDLAVDVNAGAEPMWGREQNATAAAVAALPNSEHGVETSRRGTPVPRNFVRPSPTRDDAHLDPPAAIASALPAQAATMQPQRMAKLRDQTIDPSEPSGATIEHVSRKRVDFRQTGDERLADLDRETQDNDFAQQNAPSRNKAIASLTARTAVPSVPSAPSVVSSAVARPTPPTINVTIGRVEVRAVSAPPPKAASKQSSAGASLEQYLQKRNSGGNT